MDITVRRRESDKESTLGDLFIDGEWICHTLEDEYRAVKKSGETRIPAGKYPIELKADGTSKFDASAKKNLGHHHKGMLRLVGVEGFTEVLIHTGNTEEHTAGCILVGMGEGEDTNGHHSVTGSWIAYRKVYPQIATAILAEERVNLTIIDGDRT